MGIAGKGDTLLLRRTCPASGQGFIDTITPLVNSYVADGWRLAAMDVDLNSKEEEGQVQLLFTRPPPAKPSTEQTHGEHRPGIDRIPS